MAASFAVGLDVPTLETETWTADSQIVEHWDIAVHRSSILTAQGRSALQHGSSGMPISAC